MLRFVSNTFLSNIRLKLEKNQAKSKQHPEAELLLFEYYILSSFMLFSKSNMRNVQKISFNDITVMKIIIIMQVNYDENKTENEKWIT